MSTAGLLQLAVIMLGQPLLSLYFGLVRHVFKPQYVWNAGRITDHQELTNFPKSTHMPAHTLVTAGREFNYLVI